MSLSFGHLNWQKTSARVTAGALMAGLLAWLAPPAAAQSLHGCVGLDSTPVPSVEAPDGTFFRILPDMQMETRFSDALVEQIAEVSSALATRGTTLLFVPIPTKSLAAPGALGPDAAILGYDGRVAKALYADTIAALRAKGVRTVDAVEALRGLDGDSRAHFRSDPRMTNEGLHALALASVTELGEDFKGNTVFTTAVDGELVLPSDERFLRQLSCQSELPQVATPNAKTTTTDDTDESAGVVVIGSTITSDGMRNFPGFLAEGLKRSVSQEVFGETSFSALSRYLTSDDYQLRRPDIIVWKMPIWENPAIFGDQPVRELIAAATARCSTGTVLTASDSGELRADLSNISFSSRASLRLETTDTPITDITFRFVSPSNKMRVRSVTRPAEVEATSRVFVPLSGLWPEGASEVAIMTENTLTDAQLSVCEG